MDFNNLVDDIIMEPTDNFKSNKVVTYTEYVINKYQNRISLITSNNGLDLFEYLHKQPFNKLPELVSKIYFKQMVLNIKQLHNLGIVHGDISTENFCVDFNKIKLIDFGMSMISPQSKYYKLINTLKQTKFIEILDKTIDTDNQFLCKIITPLKKVGKILYISPERHNAMIDPTITYSAYKDDIYSLGVILFCILTGYGLYIDTISCNEKRDIIENELWLSAYKNDTLKYLSKDCIDLLKNILKLENNRYSLDQILNHKWLN